MTDLQHYIIKVFSYSVDDITYHKCNKTWDDYYVTLLTNVPYYQLHQRLSNSIQTDTLEKKKLPKILLIFFLFSFIMLNITSAFCI